MNQEEVRAAYEQFEKAIHRHCDPPAEEWQFYKSNMKPKVFKKGEFFLKPGDFSNVYAFVFSGIFKQRNIPTRHPVWHEGGRSLAEMRFFEKCDREYELLSYSAEKRYEIFLHRHGENSQGIPQKDVASYIGVTPSSLNKIIKKFG